MVLASLSRTTRACALLLGTLPLLLGCNGDSAEPNINEAFIGNWFATSFIVDGNELVDPTSSFNLSFGFFSDGSYQLIVGGDDNLLFCETDPSCVDAGDFTFQGTVITLDPGTVYELTLLYSVSGDSLTVSGNLGGTPFAGVLERI